MAISKNNTLNAWLWKWHVIAGLLTLPVILMLSITGTIYLFKDDVNKAVYHEQLVASTFNDDTAMAARNRAKVLPLSTQLHNASRATDKKVASITLPKTGEDTTIFSLAGKGRAKNNLYVDPYTGEVKGEIDRKETFMYTIRKLHGELLLGTFGTLVVELFASWFIVLILTGLYVWWPREGQGIRGLFLVRFNRSKRILYRDIHAVLGFWLSVFMLIIVAGAMPWTEVFGTQLKWVQQQTESGYPTHWRSGKGIQSHQPKDTNTPRLSIDAVHHLVSSIDLQGQVTIQLPTSPTGVYKITNRAFYTENQQVIYLDQYTGTVVKRLTWDDVGILMDMRQVFMRLHEGQYGLVNWSILLLVAILFTFSSIAGFISYLMRKPKGQWGIPAVPAKFHVDKALLGIIVCLGIVFPMFGSSVVLIYIASLTKTLLTKPGIHGKEAK